MDADWDLQAVVRGCCSAASTTATTAPTTIATATSPLNGYNQQKSTFLREDNIGILTFSPDLFQTRNDNSIEQFMNGLYNLQDPPYHHHQHQISPFSFRQDPPYQHHNHRQQKPEKQFQVKQESLGVSRCTTTHTQSTTKIRKRKNQFKRVCQVPADGSSPDLWSWRKYGQKPIKGSPYPRGYYKCSTLKGCSARKQVERNRSDPGMLIITYTGEHTHPVPAQVSSLAGTTRNKTTTGDNNTGNKPSPSSPISPASCMTPVPEKMDETEKYDTDEDNNFDVSDAVIDEDTFDGLDELVGSVVGDIFPDHNAETNLAPPFPWLSNYLTTTTTTAAGGS